MCTGGGEIIFPMIYYTISMHRLFFNGQIIEKYWVKAELLQWGGNVRPNDLIRVARQGWQNTNPLPQRITQFGSNQDPQ